MSLPDAARMNAVLVDAMGRVLPGAQVLGAAVQGDLQEDLPVAVTLAVDVGAAHWQLYAACGQALCASLLARMLGRRASVSELEEMGAEALSELCNLLAGRVASVLGEQGFHVEIGLPRTDGVNPALEGQHWIHEGHVLMLALHHVAQEPGT